MAVKNMCCHAQKNFMGITEKRLLLQESQNNFLQNLQKNHFVCFFTFISSMSDDKRSRQSDVRVSAVFHLYRCIFFNHFPFFCIPVIDIYLYLYEHMPIPVQSAESIALSQPHPNLHSYIFISRKVEIYPSVLVLFWHV